MFSPELSQHWIPEHEVGQQPASASVPNDETLSPSQQEALEALVDRVNAARSIV